MSGPIVGADPADLRDRQREMGGLAEAVGRISARLTGALEAEGRCWGTDAAGSIFEAAYLRASQEVRTLLASTEADIDEIARVLGLVAATFESAEHDARRLPA